jgi:hypothetical protein
LLASCGPIQSGTLIVEAQAELAAAQTSEAKKNAPFEYVAAEEYLHKAREKQSYSDYELSVVFARKARDCARAARRIAETKVRTAMGAGESQSFANARCRPGPERTVPMADANQEPAAQEPPEPKAKKVAPIKASSKPATNEPKDPKVKQKPIKPKDDALPEGDDDPPAGQEKK